MIPINSEIESTLNLTLQQVKDLGGKRFINKLKKLGFDSISKGDKIYLSFNPRLGKGQFEEVIKIETKYGDLYITTQTRAYRLSSYY